MTSICPSCGALDRPGSSACGVCGALNARPSRRPADDPQALFAVGLTARFRCRACGHLAPLDALDVDGSVRCARCGMDQAFSASAWGEVLVQAHGVGDLGLGGREGRAPTPGLSIGAENPYAEWGGAPIRRHQPGDPATPELHVAMWPGHPVCAQCHQPLALSMGRDHVEARCPRCREPARYGVDGRALTLHDGLVGAMAEAHREDRPRAVEQGGEGAVALLCPSCGGPLTPGPDDRQVTCGFCSVVSRVPRIARDALAPDRPPERWWLVFRGPSPLRRALSRAPGSAAALTTDEAIDLLPEAPRRGGARLARWAATLGFPAAALLITGVVVWFAAAQLGL